MANDTDAINAHYGRGNLRERILDALRKTGKNPDTLTREDLSPFDEFHIGGLKETMTLAQVMKLAKGTRLLDVGCGIGGPARTLAAEFGCRVTGIDMTQEFCLAAEMLTEKLGMSQLVDFKQGSATQMPFENGQFDVVWLQHVGMNIEDKQKMYSEIRRVLRSQGRFIFHEILTGNGEPLHFPVMWAEEPSISHLATADGIRKIMASLGMTESYWEDVTERSRVWFKEMKKKMEMEGPPPVSLAVLFGKDVSANIANIARNLEEGRIIVVQACFSTR